MRRKIIATILSILGITIIGFSILLYLGFFKPQNAGILINSDPQSVVFINNKEVGVTPYEENRKPGEISIRIKPISGFNLVLDDYETKINLVSGIRTIIEREFRSSDDYTSGAIVSFEKAKNNESLVTIISIPDGADVSVDGQAYGFTPIKINIPAGDHSLLISIDGYLSKELPIVVYKGYKLTAIVKLSKVDEIISEPFDNDLTNKIKFKIRIDQNDVGFLRVRSGSSVGFPEVGQVKPGEIYDVIGTGENNKWYKIEFGDISGWVSADFVTKI